MCAHNMRGTGFRGKWLSVEIAKKISLSKQHYIYIYVSMYLCMYA